MFKGIHHFNYNGYVNALKCFEKAEKYENVYALLVADSMYIMRFNGSIRNMKKEFDYFKRATANGKTQLDNTM